MSTMEGFPFLIAADKGIYDSLGLKTKFIIFQTQTECINSFERHNIEGMVTDYSTAIILQSKGIPLQSIMQNDGYECLITNREKNIKSIKELKNINFCNSSNSFSEYAAYYVLNKARIKSTNINLPQIDQLPLRLLMMEEGQIDATFLPDPYATIAMNNGNRSLISTHDLNINQYTTIFTKDAIKNKNASIQTLIEGYNIAVNYLSKHSYKQWGDVMINRLNAPEGILGLIILPTYNNARVPDKNEIEQSILWLKGKKAIKYNYDGTKLVDSSFIKEIPTTIIKRKL